MNWMKFFHAAIIRAARTMAQCALAYIGSASLVGDVDWIGVLSSALMGGVLSILMALATGLPEVDEEGDK